MQDDDFLFEEDYDELLAEEIRDRECYKCTTTSQNAHLEKCRVCLKEFCGDCGFKGPWGRFCSQACNAAYFYGDEGDSDSEERDDRES